MYLTCLMHRCLLGEPDCHPSQLLIPSAFPVLQHFHLKASGLGLLLGEYSILNCWQKYTTLVSQGGGGGRSKNSLFVHGFQQCNHLLILHLFLPFLSPNRGYTLVVVVVVFIYTQYIRATVTNEKYDFLKNKGDMSPMGPGVFVSVVNYCFPTAHISA